MGLGPEFDSRCTELVREEEKRREGGRKRIVHVPLVTRWF